MTARDTGAAGWVRACGKIPKAGCAKEVVCVGHTVWECGSALFSGLLFVDGRWNQEVSHHKDLARVTTSASLLSFSVLYEFLSWPAVTQDHAENWFSSLRLEWWCQVVEKI